MTNANDLVNADKHTFGSKELGGGLTKREYFAAMAMQGLAAKEGSRAANYLKPNAEWAVMMADALIEALNK